MRMPYRAGNPAVKRTHSVTIRVTTNEVELIRAAAGALGWSITDMLLSSALAVGVDIKTRRDGPWPPAVERAVRAYEAVEADRLAARPSPAVAEPLTAFVAAQKQASDEAVLEAEKAQPARFG